MCIFQTYAKLNTVSTCINICLDSSMSIFYFLWRNIQTTNNIEKAFPNNKFCIKYI